MTLTNNNKQKEPLDFHRCLQITRSLFVHNDKYMHSSSSSKMKLIAKSSHSPQKFYNSFSSKNTTKSTKASFSTHHCSECWGGPLTSIQINYSSSRYDPRQPKLTKGNILNGISNLTMKQKMIRGQPVNDPSRVELSRARAELVQ
jgi:hypothetical protein